MKVSKKGEYGVKALIRLAINYEKGAPITLINDIARQENIPPKYLEQILINLKNKGILVSKRGVGGGYMLARPPERISLGEIIRVIGGPLAPVNCVSVTAHVDCPNESFCGLYGIMRDVRNAIADILDNVSLKEVAKRTLELLERKEHIVNYAI